MGARSVDDAVHVRSDLKKKKYEMLEYNMGYLRTHQLSGYDILGSQ